MKKSIKYKINDDEWTFSVLSKADYYKKNGDDSVAITDPDTKSVDFIKSKFTLQLVRHEMWHVHNFYCFFERAALGAGRLEEVSAELFAYRGDVISKQCKAIYNKLKRK